MTHIEKLGFFREIIVYCFMTFGGVLIGFLLIFGTVKKWEIIVDPPEDLWLFYSNSALKKFCGKEVLPPFNYFFGAMALFFGIFGLYNIFNIIFGF
ncbi:MAG: hypothetical protein H8E32_14675 [Nitrospinae bacterium]|nr:hypothetical protein [Nitrospinota bacterium]